MYLQIHSRKGSEQMIYTVTFNPSLDYIVTVDHFKPGIINRSNGELILPGGKGINVSIVLNNLGFENTALGFLAGFTGEEIEKRLKQSGIAADFIHVNEGLSRINVKLRSEEETEINGSGPIIERKDIDKLYVQLSSLNDGDYLTLSGSIPASIPATIYMDIIHYLQKKKVNIVVDATGDLLTKVLPYHPFLLKPNNHELSDICNAPVNTHEEALHYAKVLQEKGARNVLVSMAGQGAVLAAEDGTVMTADAPKGILKNSVGAGDSMVAGFLAGYIAEGNYADAFRKGVCTGSASAFSDYLATKEEVNNLISKNESCFKQLK
jgi:1-phosphofructokinase